MVAEASLSRKVNSSVKLNYLHYIMKQLTGYLLHPSITVDRRPLKIADFGTQTAIWSIDAAETLEHANVIVHGFDVSAASFPPAAWMPPNLTLHVHDVTVPLAKSFHGSFSVIHLRYWLSLSKAQVLQLLEHAVKLLEPGGFVQWFEHDKEATRPVASSDTPPTEAMQHFVNLVRKPFPNYEVRWLDHIPQTMQQLGLEICAVDRVPVKPSMYSQLNEIHVLGLEDVPRGVSAVVDEFKDKHMADFVGECQSGVSTNYEFVCYVARKPLMDIQIQ